LSSIASWKALSAISPALVAAPSQAETVARANGRCQLKENGYQAYNGYCTVKQKQNGGTSIFVVDLENGNRFRFSGPNRQQLHVETPSGIEQNVLFEDQGSMGRFTWNDGRLTRQLAVKTDTITNPNAQFDDHHSSSTGATLAGAAVGALIGALLSGGKHSNGSTGARTRASESGGRGSWLCREPHDLVGIHLHPVEPKGKWNGLFLEARGKLCGRAQHPESLPVLHLRQPVALSLSKSHGAAA
jgi:hypothetical protein